MFEIIPNNKPFFNESVAKNITKMMDDTAKNRARIIDDFCKVYLAETKIPISKLELVTEMTSNGYVMYFRTKRGRPKKVFTRRLM